MARDVNTPQSEIDAWLAEGNKITVYPSCQQSDPEDIKFMYKTQRTKSSAEKRKEEKQ